MLVLAWGALVYLGSLGPLLAAPLDEFVTANPGFEPWHGEGEIGVDMMNSKVDLFKFRGDPDPRNNAIGDYRGVHARGGLALTKRLWVDAGILDRKIITPYDNGESLGLHAAAQFQVTQSFGALPAIALRLSGWRDSASEANKGSPSSFSAAGTSVSTDAIRIDNPRDNQVQLDLLNTWNLSGNTSLTIFGSIGKSTVDFDKLHVTNLNNVKLTPPGMSTGEWSGTVAGRFQLQQANDAQGQSGIKATCMTSDGCAYGFSNNTGSSVSGVLPYADSFPVMTVAGTSVPSGLNIGYDSTFYQLGGSLSWMSSEWRTRLGYRFVKWNRDVDEAVMQLGKKVIDTNHFLTGEIGYKPPLPLFEHAGLFVRGQVMANQFVGEVPFSYNAFSAHKFDHRYGLLTLGVSGGF
nr:conserved uncharacterized protein [uncultured bacterium]